jgi:GR25 family glycosyltransferase involved in LPS biosynthesis
MPSVLLVHHTPYHFEVAIALYENLRSLDVYLYTNQLHRLGRQAIVDQLGIKMHNAENSYDLIIVVTKDDNKEPIEQSIKSLLSFTPTLSIQHNYLYTLSTNTMFLFPGALSSFIPVDMGFDYSDKRSRLSPKNCQFLIQGNIEDRRNYKVLETALRETDFGHFNIVGSTIKMETIPNITSNSRVSLHLNLDEKDYHIVCAKCHFILPMIDPDLYPRYFESAYTTSALIGFTHAIPFIAHRKLFEQYGLVGFAYDYQHEISGILDKAAKMSSREYQDLVHQVRSERSRISQANILRFYQLIGALGVGERERRICGFRQLIDLNGVIWDREADRVSIPIRLLSDFLRPAWGWVASTGDQEERLTISRKEFSDLLRPWLSRIPVDAEWYSGRYLSDDHGGLTPKEHFITQGYFLSYLPCKVVVDTEYYVAAYPDVAIAIANGWQRSAQAHFENHGFQEGRRPYSGWLAWDVYVLTGNAVEMTKPQPSAKMNQPTPLAQMSEQTPLFVINLDEDKDRLDQAMEALSSEQGIIVQRIAGVSGKSLPYAARHSLASDARWANNRGEIGCFLSHVKAWEAAAEATAAYSIILEDDALPNKLSRLRATQLPENFEFIFINDRMSPGSRSDDPSLPLECVSIGEGLQALSKRSNGVGGDGYIVTPAGAKKLLDAVVQDLFYGHVDWRLLRYCVQPSDLEGDLSGTELASIINTHHNPARPPHWGVVKAYCLNSPVIFSGTLPSSRIRINDD